MIKPHYGEFTTQLTDLWFSTPSRKYRDARWAQDHRKFCQTSQGAEDETSACKSGGRNGSNSAELEVAMEEVVVGRAFKPR